MNDLKDFSTGETVYWLEERFGYEGCPITIKNLSIRSGKIFDISSGVIGVQGLLGHCGAQHFYKSKDDLVKYVMNCLDIEIYTYAELEEAMDYHGIYGKNKNSYNCLEEYMENPCAGSTVDFKSPENHD